MAKSSSKVIAGVDIGTSKVTVLLGEIYEEGKLDLIGLGQSSSKGMAKGEIIDYHAVSDQVHAAIHSAEKQAGVGIDGAFLSLSGGHIEGFASEASVNVTSPDGRVQQEDLDQACRLAQGRELPENRTVIHHLRRPFRLDGRSMENPVGLEGERLEVSYWTLHGDSRKISDAIHTINGFNLHVDDIVIAGLATSAVVVSQEEKDGGVLVLDIGMGTTDYALYSRGRCLKAGCVPIGGNHLSNDLSIGLRMRLKQSESLKLRYGSAKVVHKDRSEKIWLNNDFEIGDRKLPVWSIETIIELRMVELFEVVRKKLGASYSPERVSGGVVLCGGTSNLPHVESCAEGVFEANARVGDNSSMAQGELVDTQFSTALGLLSYGLQYRSERAYNKHRTGSVFNRLVGLLTGKA